MIRVLPDGTAPAYLNVSPLVGPGIRLEFTGAGGGDHYEVIELSSSEAQEMSRRILRAVEQAEHMEQSNV